MLSLRRGHYAARLAETEMDVARAQALRHLSFRAARGLAGSDGHDCDHFDTQCRHVLVEEAQSAQLVCCFRLMPLADGREIERSYSAQHYDLSRLRGYPGGMLEMGRFCLHPDWHDPDILRVAWGAMTRIVDAAGVELLFGCSSFSGADAARHHEALAMLRAGHLAPRRWLPRVKAESVFRFGRALRHHQPDRARALSAMPPLLRSYLLMGGWVSDHAVVDHDLNTLHVFTGLEISAIPPARARLLRGVAG